MRSVSRLFLGLVLLLCCVPLKAQWSGSVDLSGGMGGMVSEVFEDKPMIHGLAQGTFQLNYQTGKFKWGTTVKGKWEPKWTDNSRLSVKDQKLTAVYKAAYTRPLTTSIKSDFQWTPSTERKYSTWILYEYKNDRAQNHSMNYNAESEESEKFSYYYELPKMDQHKFETGLNTSRIFHDGRSKLQSSLAFQAVTSQRINTWIVFKSDAEDGGTAVNLDDDVQGYAWMYRITPSGTDFKLDGDIHLQMTALDGAAQLKYAPGLRIASRHSLDQNSGATRINVTPDPEPGTWRDSTRLRENFNYLSLWAEPYLTADFHWNSVEAHANYACQIYGRRLNDDTHQQPLKIKGVYPVGKGNVKWTISPVHSLNLVNEMSVSHPDYLKICWYDRTAGYLDQLYRGNEQLLSPAKTRFALEYGIKWKRFISNTSVGYTHVSNEIDQTWFNEEIDGRLYKVFRWLNSANSHTLGLEQKLGWRGKIITANAGVVYNQTQRIAKSDGAVKKTFDWRLTGDINAKLGKGWSIGAKAKYQSKVATFFTIFKEYCELNAYVQKDFKHITLYLEGHDLLDQPRETSFESEELKEYWVEEVRSNRRMYIIGAKWKF